MNTIVFNLIHEIENQQHWNLQLTQKQRQHEISLKIGRIQHVDDQIDLLTLKICCRYTFLIAIIRQGIGTRKVYNMIAVSSPAYIGFFFFNGNPRPVSNLEIRIAERIDPRTLSHVRISDKGHMIVHSSTSPSMQAASLLRRIS